MNYDITVNITTITTIHSCNKKYLKLRLPEKACLIPANFPAVSLSIKKKSGLVFATYIPFLYDTTVFSTYGIISTKFVVGQFE